MNKAGSNEYIQLIEKYGPAGHNQEGRAPTYFLEDRAVTISDLEEDEIRRNIRALNDAGIETPKTNLEETYIPIYGFGEATVVEQELVEQSGPEYFLENEEQLWLEHLREIGYRAARNNLRLDFGLDNFGFQDGEPVFYDLQDHESVWHNEPLPFHLMGNYLERSLNYLSRDYGLEAPETRDMAEVWKSIK